MAGDTPFGGATEPGWGRVAEAFRSNFDGHSEVGAQVAVYHRGRKVADLWGGHFDEARTRPYTDDTLQLVFSTTKGVVAVAVAQCVQRGLLSYGDLVSAHWPEFAAAGKGDVTVAQLLSHQAGLAVVEGEPTRAQALDWEFVTDLLANTAPVWPPGEGHGYHALTYGWLAGELVRRVDPAHRSIGQYVADEIVAPISGADERCEFRIGTPASEHARVSPMVGGLVDGSDNSDMDPGVRALMEQYFGPASLAGRALTLNGALAVGATYNQPDVLSAQIPAANGVGTARTLARIYAATIGELDGVRLLDQATLDVARTTVTPENEPDKCLIFPTTFGMGFMTHGMVTPYSGPGAFGHAGAGGSVAFAHPERELALAYCMNQMARNLANDARTVRLTEAAVACADAVG